LNISNGETTKFGEDETLFTRYDTKTGSYIYKEDRPVLILSSTSYTPDENFMVLVEALDKLEHKLSLNKEKDFVFPKLQFIITGKGP